MVSKRKKLVLHKETLRELSRQDMARVVGAGPTDVGARCATLNDTQSNDADCSPPAESEYVCETPMTDDEC